MNAEKKTINRIVSLSFTLTNVNRAKIAAVGEVTSGGWSAGELVNPRVGDGILHLDFVATPPSGPSDDALHPIEASYTQWLAAQPQEVTVHAERNEESITLPATGDPA